jgi:hypothetical protein
MAPQIIVYFCKGPIDTFLYSPLGYLPLQTYKRQRVMLKNVAEDTILVLSDYKNKEIYGICRVHFWPDTESCLKLISTPDTHHGPELYHIAIHDYIILNNSISYSDIRIKMHGLDINGTGNIWRRSRNCLPIFQNGDKSGDSVREFSRFICNLCTRR